MTSVKIITVPLVSLFDRVRHGKCSATAPAVDHAAKRIDFWRTPGISMTRIAFEHSLDFIPSLPVDDRFLFARIKIAFVFNQADIEVIFEHPVNHLIIDLLPITLDPFLCSPRG